MVEAFRDGAIGTVGLIRRGLKCLGYPLQVP